MGAPPNNPKKVASLSLPFREAHGIPSHNTRGGVPLNSFTKKRKAAREAVHFHVTIPEHTRIRTRPRKSHCDKLVDGSPTLVSPNGLVCITMHLRFPVSLGAFMPQFVLRPRIPRADADADEQQPDRQDPVGFNGMELFLCEGYPF